MSSKNSQRVSLLGLSLFLVILSTTAVNAASSNISRSYESRDAVKPGMLVSFTGDSSTVVVPANIQNSTKLIGVAVATNDSLLAVDEKKGKAQIATSGSAKVLVSDINGAIAIGDQVSVSPLSGIGVKAGPGTRIIGTSQSSFDKNAPNTSQQQITDKSGKQTTTTVGAVSVTIAIGSSGSGLNDANLTALQRFGKSVTGHVVSTPRLLLGIAVAVVSLAILVTLIYSSIFAGIISVGRNPLAKYAIFRSIGTVMLMVVAVSAISFGTIYTLLK